MSNTITIDRRPGALGRIRERAGLRSGALRAPHHACSLAAIRGHLRAQEGGGLTFMPGEISLAAGGTLILDDLTEFRRETIEAIAEAVRDRELRFYVRPKEARDGLTLTVRLMPFAVAATVRACPCDVPESCRCTEGARARYEKRIREFVAILENRSSRDA